MKRKLSNDILKEKYNLIYKKGAYEKYFTFNPFEILKSIIDQQPSWKDLDVLDFGCGEGDLAAMLSFAGAKSVHAIDYSSEAIQISKIVRRLYNFAKRIYLMVLLLLEVVQLWILQNWLWRTCV